MKTVFVTGGGGFLGGKLIQELVRRGVHVRALMRKESQAFANLGVEIIRGDLRDVSSYKPCLYGVDTVLHAASKVALWGRWSEFYETNVIGTKNLLSAAVNAGVEKFVYTSTPSVVFNGADLKGVDESTPYAEKFLSPYPKSKAMAEQIVLAAAEKFQFPTVALRPHLMWGPGDTHLIPQIASRQRAGKLVQIGDGNNLVDFTYIDNVIEAHLLAAEALTFSSALSGKAYFISQDEPIKLWDFVARVLKCFNLPPPTKKISLSTAVKLGSALELAYSLFKLPIFPFTPEPRLTKFLALQLGTSHYFSNANARTDFGYVPKVTMKEGLKNLTSSHKA